MFKVNNKIKERGHWFKSKKSLKRCRTYVFFLFRVITPTTLAFTAWKVSKYRVFSGPYSPVFGLNTERHFVSLRISPYSIRMRENTDQEKLRIWTLFTQCLPCYLKGKRYLFNKCCRFNLSVQLRFVKLRALILEPWARLEPFLRCKELIWIHFFTFLYKNNEVESGKTIRTN